MGSLDDLIAAVQGPLVQALDAAQYGLAVALDDGAEPHPIFISEAGAKILGFPRDELMQRPMFACLAPEETPRMLERRELQLRGEPVPNPFDVVIIRKCGERAAIEVGTSAQLLDQGHATIAFFRDVSERRAMQNRLAIADRMATVGTVAAGVAHEINNPLTYVLLNLDRIESAVCKLGGAEQQMTNLRAALDDARNGAQRVRNVVADLRSFSHTADENRPVDVRRVVSSAINIAMPDIREKARLDQDLAETPRVEANEGKLGQVFLNLLMNAVQAIPPGEPEQNEIRVTTDVDNEHRVVVEVADTGPGMEPEVLRKAFDPFFTTKPIGVGTGLGLSICHKIVTSLGGEIEAESRVGKGTVFRVILPCL